MEFSEDSRKKETTGEIPSKETTGDGGWRLGRQPFYGAFWRLLPGTLRKPQGMVGDSRKQETTSWMVSGGKPQGMGDSKETTGDGGGFSEEGLKIPGRRKPPVGWFLGTFQLVRMRIKMNRFGILGQRKPPFLIPCPHPETRTASPQNSTNMLGPLVERCRCHLFWGCCHPLFWVDLILFWLFPSLG